MKKNILMFVTVIFSLLNLSYAYCEDVELDRIVITPYRTWVSAKSSGTTVENIDISELEHKSVASLKDALNESSSVAVASSGSLGGNASVFLRGHNSNHTRFMLDGIKIYDPLLT